MQLTIRLLRETDGRWIGDIPELPGVTVYGSTHDEATLKVKALALRVIAEEIEHGRMPPAVDALQFVNCAVPFDSGSLEDAEPADAADQLLASLE